MFWPLLAIFRFPQYFKKSLQNWVRAYWWKRSPCINPLITLFLVQMPCVNSEKVVSSGKYGGAPPYFPLDTTFSLFTHGICTRNRVIRGLMHGDLFHQYALTQFCRLFLKYCGNLKMANKGQNMYFHFLEYITSYLSKLCCWLYSLSFSSITEGLRKVKVSIKKWKKDWQEWS